MLTAAILGLTLAATTVHASLVHPEAVDQAEVMRAASVILVVEPADPPLRVVDDGVVHDEPCAYGVSRFVVRERVKAPDGIATVGEIMEIAPADFELYCAMNQAYERGDPVPSPIIPEYHGERQPPATGLRIIYLSASGAGPWRFAISNAWDPTDELEALKKRLATPTPHVE